MTPSKYQNDFYRELTTTENNIFINAVAGSGKTTTIVNSIKLLPRDKRIAFFAFNKDIKEEIQSRVPPYITVSTLHSFGARSLYMHLGKLKFDEHKVFAIALKKFAGWRVEENKQSYSYRVAQLVDKMRMTLCPLEEQAIEKLARRFGIDIFGYEPDHAMEVLKASNVAAQTIIDYTDMVYIPVLNKMKLRKFDITFVDEMQDLNACGQQLIKAVISPKGGRLVGVGDPHQSIYGFAGADLQSFENMKTMLPNSVEMPLSVCYRCGKNIVTYAKTLVKHIEAFEDQDPGKIRMGSHKEIQAGDWVLCRNTRPLVALFAEFLKQHKKAYIKGREIGTNLIHFINRRKCASVARLLELLDKDRLDLKIKLIKCHTYQPERDSKMVEFDEKVKIIRILGMDTPEVKDLVKRIQSIFLDKGEGICLSTIHKAKGGEADRVFILFKELMPSQYAKTPEDFVQEENIKYVCITRAKKELVFINDFTLEEEL